MINNLSNNSNLIKILNVKNLYFTASEVVFSRGKDEKENYKIDIVAHDGAGKVFLFEMKAPGNKKDKPIEQVNGYIKEYGKNGKKNEVFEKIMSNYPQNSISKINEIIGYAIVGYSENPVPSKENKFLIKCL